MKNSLLFLILFLSLILSSCATKTYFQMYDLESDSLEVTDDALIYENSYFIIGFNFWKAGGSGSFIIKNKTDSILYIDLGNSYSVRNGLATPYFLNRTFTESSSQMVSNYNFFSADHSSSSFSGSSLFNFNSNNYNVDGFVSNRSTRTSQRGISGSGGTTTISKTSGIMFQERRIISIPARAAKRVNGSPFQSRPLLDCDLVRNPTRNQISSLTFDRKNTPLYFTNVISYSFQESDLNDRETIEMSFWVTKISNMPFNTFTQRVNRKNCGEPTRAYIYTAIYGAPYRFFIRYTGM